MQSTAETVKKARKVGTPLIGINCFDPEATITAIQQMVDPSKVGIIQWDVVNGARPRNEQGIASLSKVTKNGKTLSNPVLCLQESSNFPDNTIFFLINGHQFLAPYYDGRAEYIQAIWNIRDQFKGALKTLIILAPQLDLPAELRDDFLLIDEPLPSSEELEAIVRQTLTDASISHLVDDANVIKAVDALRGVSAFPAEQAVAMSISAEGMDLSLVWERKRQLIDSTPGLGVWRGEDRFADLGGVKQVKEFMGKIITGLESPRVVVFIDEIEKMMAGASGMDSTGVSQDQLGVLLSEMENRKYGGSIFIGPPGACKSAVAKAVGNEAGIPTITFDLGGMKDSLVGSSETRIRNALKVIDAVGGGQALFIATCNKLASIPPELRRRFTMGTFFFDLPTAEERSVIWRLYQDKWQIESGQMTYDHIDDEDWTGAEIRQCCLLAYRLRMTLKEASHYIIPVAKSAAADIELLRRNASGNFLSASDQGIYLYQPELVNAEPGSIVGKYGKSRKFNNSEETNN